MRNNVLSQVGYILYDYMMKAAKNSKVHLGFTDKILSTYRGISAEYVVNLKVGDVITNNTFTSIPYK
jgi:hypothetical protein